jgi:hypothetical protein
MLLHKLLVDDYHNMYKKYQFNNFKDLFYFQVYFG